MSHFLTILVAALAAGIVTVVLIRVTPARQHPHRRSRADRLADLKAKDADDEAHWDFVKTTFPENATDYEAAKPKQEYL